MFETRTPHFVWHYLLPFAQVTQYALIAGVRAEVGDAGFLFNCRPNAPTLGSNIGGSMRPSIIIAVAACCGLDSASIALRAQSAQTQAAERRFEVASVKAALSPAELGRLAAQSGQMPSSFGIQTSPGGWFRASPVTLKQLIAHAFDVTDYQIDGGPKWLASDYFEINATAAAEATPAEIRTMLRTLLSERFGLRTHSDIRQTQTYVLTVARSDGRLGPRLTRTTAECIQQIDQWKNRTDPPAPPTPADRARAVEEAIRLRSAPPVPRCGSSMTSSRANGASAFAFGGKELTLLVSRLSSVLSAPVVDRTELAGLFDVTLEYLSERTTRGRVIGLDPNSTDSLPPDLASALQQQLGLKLEKQIGPTPVLVIDAAEHPTPD